jgi:mono/diheme cytochrome c family protein
MTVWSKMAPSHSNRHQLNLAGALLYVTALLPCVTTLADGSIDKAAPVSFEKTIRPILTDKCLACHGQDDSARQADLRLDNRDAAIAHGAIVPSDIKSGSLLERIRSTDPELVMPPPESHKELTEAERQALESWIAEGATYELHWSFQKPQMPSIPEVADTKWIQNPIDNFIHAKLSEVGLTPADEADLRTLVRRVCLDLTGLPPMPAEIDEVINDTSPDRYERYVDRLLDRETWGEHRGRYWLDYARYADTHGIHFDNYREMYSYRDWVIEAFNQNMPFDQFTIEQLAGDMLPNASLDQKIATGFHRCNITTNEGGIIDEEYVVLYARDRVETTGAVWLGLTVGCAVCHNHKFDPITQKEFYEFSAFFNNTTQGPRDGNIKDTPPIVRVPLADDREQYEAAKVSRDALTPKLAERRAAAEPEFKTWFESGEASKSLQVKYDKAATDTSNKLLFHAPLAEAPGTQISYTLGTSDIQQKSLAALSKTTTGQISDQAWLVNLDQLPTWSDVGNFENNQAFSVAMWVKPTANTSGASLVARMNPGQQFRGWDVWIEANKPAMHIVNKWPDDAIKVVADQPLPADQWSHLTITYDGSMKGKGIKCFVNGSEVAVKAYQDTLKNSIKTDVPFKLGGRNTGAEPIGVGIEDLRLYEGMVSEDSIKTISIDAKARRLVAKANSINDADRAFMFDYYLSNIDPQFVTLSTELAAATKSIDAIEARGTIAHIMNERESSPMAYILQRGDYDKRLDEVTARTPSVLHSMKEDWPRNRLGLAMWLTSPDNPLTARVTVNRCWQELFGRGLVATSGDFGLTGQLPSNQDLLDYLAIDFMQNGWDMKQLYRQMVLSSTYRQSAQVTPEKLERDADNVLLSRGPRFRMDAEMVRDYALASSGLLNPTIGGRSVRPYQPEGVWEAVAMPESNTKAYTLDEAPMVYRRSMYTFWKRSAPPASMDIFNAPAREVCAVKRERTNTPLQALVTMNDPQFLEAARVVAEKTLAELGIDDTARLQSIAQRIIGRSFNDDEVKLVLETLSAAREFYSQDVDAAKNFITVGLSTPNADINQADLAAFTLVTNQLLNLDEALCK